MSRLVRLLLAVSLPTLLSLPLAAQDAANSKPSTPPLNLNTATAEQLEALPGIGAATAARIVEYREKNGPFKKVEDLMNVRGIGEKSFLRLKPLIVVTTPKTDKAAGPSSGPAGQ